MSDLTFEPMYVVAERVARREVSPVELIVAALERVAGATRPPRSHPEVSSPYGVC